MDGHTIPGNFSKNPLVCSPGNRVVFAYDDLHHSDVITESGHKFQAHMLTINSLQKPKAALTSLHQNVDVASSEHLLYAYRLLDMPSSTVVEGHNDDRDWAAGSIVARTLADKRINNVLLAISHREGPASLGKRRLTILNDLATKLTELTADCN